jgi:hypothetical protein
MYVASTGERQDPRGVVVRQEDSVQTYVGVGFEASHVNGCQDSVLHAVYMLNMAEQGWAGWR